MLSLFSISETGFLESNRLALRLYCVIVGWDLNPNAHRSNSTNSPPKFHFPQSLNEFEMAIYTAFYFLLVDVFKFYWPIGFDFY